MRRSLLAFVAILVIGSCGTPTKPATSPTPSSSLTSDAPSPSEPIPAGFVYITFSSDQAPIDWPNELWYFEFEAGASKRLTRDGLLKYRPRLKRSDTVAYIGRDEKGNEAVFEVSLTGSGRREILHGEDVHALAWSPSGDVLAFATGREVKIARNGMNPSTIRRFTLPKDGYGRGGRDDDEQIVAWSPDGSKLLVQLTEFCCRSDGSVPSLYVLGLDGNDIVPPMRATFARWSPDGRRIYAREFDTSGHGDYEGRLFSLDVTTGAVRFLRTRRDVFNLAVSPDGAHLAHDAGGADPSTYLFDLRSNEERRLANGVMPLWFDSSHLIVTNARKCANSGNDICGGEAGIPWHPTGTSSIISLAGDEPRVLRAHWTYDAALVVPSSS